MSLIHDVTDLFLEREGSTSKHISWEIVDLRDVCKVQNGYAFKSSEFNSVGKGMPLIRIRDIVNGETKTFYDGTFDENYIVELNDLLVGMDGDFNHALWQGNVALLNQRVCRLIPDEEFLLKKFLFYGLGDYLLKINENTSATTVKHLSSKSIGDIPFVLPPLQEQRRIVEKLDALFGHLDTLKVKLDRIPELLKNFRQQVLDQAVTGKLTEEWRKGKKIYEWIKVPFGELMMGNPKNGAYYPKNQYGSGTRIIRIDAFYDGFIKNWNSLQRVVVPEPDIKTYGIKVDDIIVNRVNSMDYLGKCMLVENLPEPTIYESNMMRITLDKSKVLPKYARTFLISQVGLKELRKNAKQAVNQASINQTDVKNVIFNVPEIVEQKEIIKVVEEHFALANKIEEHYQKLNSKIKRLPQAILHKGFKGELVSQDPNDEPASVLLERIKEAKKDNSKPFKEPKTVKERPVKKISITTAYDPEKEVTKPEPYKPYNEIPVKTNLKVVESVGEELRKDLADEFFKIQDYLTFKTIDRSFSNNEFTFETVSSAVRLSYDQLWSELRELLHLTELGMRPGLKQRFDKSENRILFKWIKSGN